MVVEFRVLGPVNIAAQGRSLSPTGRRERTLLALLLISLNRVVASERLADELWPAHPPKEALHSLRVAMSRLRKTLGELGGADLLATQAPGYVIRSAPETLDLACFEALVARARGEMAANEHRQAGETLRQALSLWRGGALADVAETPLVRLETARLEEARLTALEARVEADLAAGRHTELTAELEALARSHPLREALWGHRMLAFYRSGRQAEALRAYQELRRILGEELGIEPSVPLVELEGAILRQDPGLAWTAETTPVRRVPGGGVSFADRTPFVGREAERAELNGLLERAGGGEGGLVLIGGEPGVGKSRLVEELALQAAGRFRVLIGHCYESGRDLSYMPWVELIEAAMADTDPAELRRALGDEAPEFARLVPELRRLLPDIPSPVELPPEQQRRYTFNSIREYVTRVSRSQPRLFVLEDLHWADESTLLLLEHLAERLESIPCLVVGTHRSAPTDITPLLAETLSNLVRRRQTRQINLPRHSEAEVDGLLQALSKQTPPEAVRAAIYADTDGNAFFVEEVFRHLAESGRLLDEDGRFRTDLAIGELDVPANVRLVIGRRLDRLDEPTARVLSIAAVAGRHLGFELWEAIAGIGGDDLIDVVEAAERAGLIVTERAGEQEEYWFAHELIRQTALTRLPAARRRRHHLRVAEALEALHAENPAAHAANDRGPSHRGGIGRRPRPALPLPRPGRHPLARVRRLRGRPPAPPSGGIPRRARSARGAGRDALPSRRRRTGRRQRRRSHRGVAPLDRDFRTGTGRRRHQSPVPARRLESRVRRTVPRLLQAGPARLGCARGTAQRRTGTAPGHRRDRCRRRRPVRGGDALHQSRPRRWPIGSVTPRWRPMPRCGAVGSTTCTWKAATRWSLFFRRPTCSARPATRGTSRSAWASWPSARPEPAGSRRHVVPRPRAALWLNDSEISPP